MDSKVSRNVDLVTPQKVVNRNIDIYMLITVEFNVDKGDLHDKVVHRIDTKVGKKKDRNPNHYPYNLL